jgi:flagellar biogenesis protein FliO
VACVLGLVFLGVYYLNKFVDQNAREGGSVRQP